LASQTQRSAPSSKKLRTRFLPQYPDPITATFPVKLSMTPKVSSRITHKNRRLRPPPCSAALWSIPGTQAEPELPDKPARFRENLLPGIPDRRRPAAGATGTDSRLPWEYH